MFFLALAYFENTFLLEYINQIFANPTVAVTLVFLHNVITVSLIIIGMAFYAKFVLNFLPKRDMEYAVLHHPRLFAGLFTAIILIISILRVSALLQGQILMDLISIIMIDRYKLSLDIVSLACLTNQL